jgi:hypothetical protein
MQMDCKLLLKTLLESWDISNEAEKKPPTMRDFFVDRSSFRKSYKSGIFYYFVE